MQSKKLLVLILIISLASILPLQADQSLRILIPNNEWHIPAIPFCYIRFSIESYIMGAYEGAGDFAHGTYKIIDDERISITIPRFKDELILRYNPGYATIYVTGPNPDSPY